MVNKNDIDYQKYLFHQGTNSNAFEFMGAHREEDGGWVFRVWAPRAKSVSLCGSFNDWAPGDLPLERLDDDDEIWQVKTHCVNEGDLYKFAILTSGGSLVFKADPYAFATEEGSGGESTRYASKLYDIKRRYAWSDDDWIKNRAADARHLPMNIYEVNLGSWKRREDGGYYSFRDNADELLPYAKDMGYTHIEVMPVTEFPYDGSWGYQTTGYYAVSSRYGTPDDFCYFVDKAHELGIGIILDWVPAHFPRDAFALAEFDGEPLYEDSDPLRRQHKDWGTLAFDFGRPEVRSFLISSAGFFCKHYHIDGIRVDAVAAMLYLDYGRSEGEWHPNKNGGRENLEAVLFLQKLNESIGTEYPGVITIAEESTTWPLVTMPPEDGGLGFHFKWNMGWMNDSLKYFSLDPLFRKDAHNMLTFSIAYAYSENFILPISHDEVVHGKKSLLDKMPGEYEEKFAGERAFLTYMMTHPGKKLIFMGSEFGQFIEWNEKKALDWMLLDYDKHRQMQEFVRDLNHLYLAEPALWEQDDSYDGFDWIDADDRDHNVYSYIRNAKDGERLLVVINLSGGTWDDYPLALPYADFYECILDTDVTRYGGSGLRENGEGASCVCDLQNTVSACEPESYSDEPGDEGRVPERRGEEHTGETRKYSGRIYKAEKNPDNKDMCRIRITLPPLSAMILRKI